MYQVVVTSLVLVFIIVAIVTQKIPTIALGLLIPLILSVTGVIDASTAFTGLGSTTVFLIVGAQVIGDACFRKGMTDWIGRRIIRYTRRFRSDSLKLLIICLLAASLSAFLSSAGVQVALLSLILVMARSLNLSKTRSLIALGYSATIGGMWSIIGTTLMVISKSTYEAAVPGETIGMFEITRASFPVGLACILLYCFVTSRYQPDRCGREEPADIPDPGKAVIGSSETVQPGLRRDYLIIGVTFLAFIVLVALDGKTPIPAAMVTVLVLLVFGAFRISTVSDMVNCISWDVVLFVVGITVLSNAMVSSGLSELVGSLLLQLVGHSRNPYLIIGSVSLVCLVMTQLMSNAGAFSVVLPFLTLLSDSLSVNLKPLIIAAAISCTCGFCLPLATPTYMLLAKEGNVRVTDWLAQGLPLAAMALALTTALVPNLWPL